MTRCQRLDSVAVFGSAARGDRDRMSDKDILIVSDDSQARRSSAARLRRSGWSPVAFSWRRLERTGSRKGLFVQHLKLEASVLKDRDGRLKDFFNRFRVKPEYDQEVEESRALIGILESIPKSLIGRYWALDVLAVGFRSLAVATLANHGIYQFSADSILSSLRKVGVLKADDVRVLRGMREFKWRYRGQRLERGLSIGETQKYVDLVSRRFGLGLHSRIIQADEALGAVVNARVGPANWYLQSRLLERGLLGLQTRPDTDPGVLHLKRQFQTMLKEPSQYGWRIKRQWDDLKEQLCVIADHSKIGF